MLTNFFIACLLIPGFFLNHPELFLPSVVPANLLMVVLFAGLLLFGGYLSFVFWSPVAKMRPFIQHNIIVAIKKGDRPFIFGQFLFFMIFEEIVFRFYLLGIVLTPLDRLPAIFLSSAIFAVYHLTMFKKFPDWFLVGLIMIFSFFLGTFLGLVLFELGILASIFAHFGIVYVLYSLLAHAKRFNETTAIQN